MYGNLHNKFYNEARAADKTLSIFQGRPAPLIYFFEAYFPQTFYSVGTLIVVDPVLAVRLHSQLAALAGPARLTGAGVTASLKHLYYS